MTQYPRVLRSGSNAAVAVAAAPLGADSEGCLSITVIANNGNTDNIFLGDEQLQPILLLPGNVASFDLISPGQIWVRSASGVQVADFLMEV